MSMLAIILPVVISAALTAMLVPLIIRLSYKKKLFDSVNERKVHHGVVPRLGGGAFILSVLVAMGVLLLMPGYDFANDQIEGTCCVWRYVALIAGAGIIYLAGVWDDIRNLNYKIKLQSQLIAAIVIVVGGGFWISNLHGLFGVDILPAAVGMPVSVLFIMFIINAFNLIDGIDGLASALGFAASLVMGILLIYCNQLLIGVMALALAASLVVFFCYNKLGRTSNKTKVFMGDGGSQTMGLLIAFLVVYVSGYSNLPLMVCEGEVGSFSLGLPGQNPLPFILSMSMILIPCLDALRVMISRIFQGHNPFLADQTHIHHKFLRMGCNSSVTLAIIFLLQLVLTTVNLAIYYSEFGISQCLQINLILLTDIILWCALNVLLNQRLKRVERAQ